MIEDKSFEELVEKHQSMIYFHIKHLNIRQHHEEYYQIGLIALWHASKTYDSSKGSFSTYLYHCIKGRMLNEMNKQNRRHEKEELRDQHDDFGTEDPIKEIMSEQMVQSYGDILTPMQKKWLIGYCIDKKTPTEIAESENVSPASVKSWRREAIKKIKAITEKS